MAQPQPPAWKVTALAALVIAGLVVGIGKLRPLLLDQQAGDNPNAARGIAERKPARARSYMVAAANPYASRAGLEILRAGGSAIDAAVAVQMALNLAEPQSSGIGGGAFIVYWDAAAKRLTTYDGRERAPAAARPDRFLVGGKPRGFRDAVFGGLSVGVPGTLRVLEMAHKRHGRLPWKRLFTPVIALADDGFVVSRRLNLLLRWFGAGRFGPAAGRYFFDAGGSPRPVGHKLKNPAFARTLRAIAKNGADVFYTGPIAQQILRAVRGAPNHQSDMTAADLAAYRPKLRQPVCITYRKHKVCGMGPPSSGGVTVAQVLKLIEPFDLGRGPEAALNAKALHLIAEAEKLAFADRERYMADADFVPVPTQGLLDENYLAVRRRLISPTRAMKQPKAGLPPGVQLQYFGAGNTVENDGTSHISIIDGKGNALAMTTTIEGAFGSGLMAGGFLLNNELTDFAFVPVAEDGRPVANAVGPMKRPRSSMAPTIVFDSAGNVKAVLGSPGGSRIILYVVKTLIALIDWRLDAQAAAALMNFGSRGGALEFEAGLRTAGHALKAIGYWHRVSLGIMNSGVHVIAVSDSARTVSDSVRDAARDAVLEGGADPRREGVALGD